MNMAFGGRNFAFQCDYFQITKIVSRGYIRELNAVPWEAARFKSSVQRRLKEPLRWQLDAEQSRKFLDIIKRAPNRVFVIVLSPLHESFYVGSTGEAKFREQMVIFEQQHNVRVVDFSHVNYPDNYFQDTAHLNYRGAGVFSQQLAERLNSIGVLLRP
jgi:hypothetical protein